MILEDAIDELIMNLSKKGFSSLKDNAIDWDEFMILSNLIHSKFNVPATSITEVMRRFLYGVSSSINPKTVVGVGTYYGYAISWILSKGMKAGTLKSAFLFDPDVLAMQSAKQNIGVLPGESVKIHYLSQEAQKGVDLIIDDVDLLYLDLDHPLNGKYEYVEALAMILPKLRPGAIILAHDAIVNKFEKDMARYASFLDTNKEICLHRTLRIDEYGISIAMKGE